MRDEDLIHVHVPSATPESACHRLVALLQEAGLDVAGKRRDEVTVESSQATACASVCTATKRWLREEGIPKTSIRRLVEGRLRTEEVFGDLTGERRVTVKIPRSCDTKEHRRAFEEAVVRADGRHAGWDFLRDEDRDVSGRVVLPEPDEGDASRTASSLLRHVYGDGVGRVVGLPPK